MAYAKKTVALVMLLVMTTCHGMETGKGNTRPVLVLYDEHRVMSVDDQNIIKTSHAGKISLFLKGESSQKSIDALYMTSAQCKFAPVIACARHINGLKDVKQDHKIIIFNWACELAKNNISDESVMIKRYLAQQIKVNTAPIMYDDELSIDSIEQDALK
ncbi:MAG: hypothetical protein WC707_02755 [Candidatus Babeliaceae bacterium]|jgi:hypothetical protein